MMVPPYHGTTVSESPRGNLHILDEMGSRPVRDRYQGRGPVVESGIQLPHIAFDEETPIVLHT